MVAEDENTESEPIYLTSSVGQLGRASRLFIALHENLATIGPRQESSPAWKQFADAFRDLDMDAYQHPFSFWGNMIFEQLQP
ncbi:hypothetical protein CGZ80_27255 [Rhodopirellula sp. MGV]|nr:hypothetical protein CGZ80_27255 [Rhodopirellula sp. MGV]